MPCLAKTGHVAEAKGKRDRVVDHGVGEGIGAGLCGGFGRR